MSTRHRAKLEKQYVLHVDYGMGSVRIDFDTLEQAMSAKERDGGLSYIVDQNTSIVYDIHGNISDPSSDENARNILELFYDQ